MKTTGIALGLVALSLLAPPSLAEDALDACMNRCDAIFDEVDQRCGQRPTRFMDACAEAAQAEEAACLRKCIARYFALRTGDLTTVDADAPGEPSRPPAPGGPPPAPHAAATPAAPAADPSRSIDVVRQDETSVIFAAEPGGQDWACKQVRYAGYTEPVQGCLRVSVDGRVEDALCEMGGQTRCLCGRQIEVTAVDSNVTFEHQDCSP